MNIELVPFVCVCASEPPIHCTFGPLRRGVQRRWATGPLGNWAIGPLGPMACLHDPIRIERGPDCTHMMSCRFFMTLNMFPLEPISASNGLCVRFQLELSEFKFDRPCVSGRSSNCFLWVCGCVLVCVCVGVQVGKNIYEHLVCLCVRVKQTHTLC